MDELAKEIWETLSAIDVSSHIEKKNNLTTCLGLGHGLR